MDQHDLDQLDGWLDGQLDPDHAAEFERRLAAEPELRAEADRQRAVDATLRRAFEPPAAIAGPAASPAPLAGPGSGRHGPWFVAAAAAALVGVGLWAALGPRGDTGIGEDAPILVADYEGDDGHDGRDEPGGLQPRTMDEVNADLTGPDVESLLARVCDAAACAPGPDGAGPGNVQWAEQPTLQESLALRYDECLDVETPSSCTLLGPFVDPAWESATLLVGVCTDDLAGGKPSLIAIDDQSMNGCGFEPKVGGLQPFYKEENGLAVWEFTLRGAPQFLDAVKACR